MTRALPTVSRRRVLVGMAALTLLGGTAATACSATAPVEDVDALLVQLDRARADGELAGNAATAAAPTLAAALTAVAAQRAAHAKALTEEITRVSGQAPPTPPTSTSAGTTTTNPTTTTTGPQAKPPTAADVIAALGTSADGAALLATQQTGYRAGLLGSIAAACTAAATVALAATGPAS